VSREFEGRTAVITGAGTGIGAATAEELARSGARVILVSRKADRLEQTAKRLRDEGHDALALAADITDPTLLVRLAELAPEVDILVNNAAVFASYGPVEEVPQDEIDALFDVDLRAVLILVRFVLPGMKRRSFGRIINIGSVAGSLGAAGQVAYSTAKCALEGMTRAVASECSRQGVTCNLVEPGLIATERVTQEIPEEIRDHLIRATPVARAGSAEEVAYAVAFLATQDAAFITGATLPVGGGIGLGIR